MAVSYEKVKDDCIWNFSEVKGSSQFKCKYDIRKRKAILQHSHTNSFSNHR